MNKAILIGRLTKDPELRTTPTGRNVCQFSIAVNRNFTNANGEREADFINIVVWRKQAENVKNYVKQGSQVAIDGKIQTRTYDDQNGQKRYITEVVADNIQFLDTKAAAERRQTASSNSYNDVNPYSFSPEMDVPTSDLKDDPFKDFGEEIKVEDNDLPF